MFRVSNLKKIKSGAFKARKAIPTAVREAYQRLHGQGWEAIFRAPPCTAVKDERSASRRWVPWLLAYTGARAGEVAQLRAGDVDLTGRAISIDPTAGTVKTGKMRVIPIHEHLIEQGFLRYVQDVLGAKGAKGGLFYEGTNDGKSRRSDGAANKLAGWVRRIGVTDPGISPNHAWRHTFKAKARRAKIEEGIRDAICGHSARSALRTTST
jgi:integrase